MREAGSELKIFLIFFCVIFYDENVGRLGEKTRDLEEIVNGLKVLVDLLQRTIGGACLQGLIVSF